MDNDQPKLISLLTSKEAFDNGTLIDVTKEAKKSGFKVPVAISSKLYNDHITPPLETKDMGQSKNDRLHDVFFLTQNAAIKSNGIKVEFECMFVMAPGPRFKTVNITAMVDINESLESSIIIFLSEELS